MDLTIEKITRLVARCTSCNYERPYRDGDEKRPCPACGGSARFWSTKATRIQDKI